MEQVRFITAIVICFFLYLAWAYFFSPPPVPPPASKTAKMAQNAAGGAKAEPGGATAASGAPAAGTGTTALASAAAATPATAAPLAALPAPGRLITVETPLYTARFSSRGGTVTDFTLKKYRESTHPHSPAKEMIHLPEGDMTLGTSFTDGSVPELSTAMFTTDARDRVDVAGKPADVVFSWTSAKGLSVEKRYTFDPATYAFNLAVTVRNRSALPLTDCLALEIRSLQAANPSRYGFEGPEALVKEKLTEGKAAKLKKNGALTETGVIHWAGVTDRYFLCAVAPQSPQEASAVFSAQAMDKEDLVSVRYVNPRATIPPGAERTYGLRVFMGPKSMDALKAAGGRFQRALSFGMWAVIAKPLLLAMDAMYRVIPNYGLAIMLLTFIIKLIFWPLSAKSYKSMSAMKKLQPLMQEIRERYKDDKKRMNEEVFALYRTYKVNPMSGCLPILLQIPVFFALWRMLYGAIELRHAAFWGWINDLSEPDRLMPSLHVPFVEPSGIPILTLVMGVTMFIQQKMSPPPGDPTQARMMMALPIVFTFIFINLPSGLVLYWLVNNILSIAQQSYIQKKYK